MDKKQLRPSAEELCNMISLMSGFATAGEVVNRHVSEKAERMVRAFWHPNAVDAQAERIRALEAAILTAPRAEQIVDDVIRNAARRETATAIAREIEECLQKMALTIPSVDAERVCRGICRANGSEI